MTVPCDVGPDCHPSGRPFRNVFPRPAAPLMVAWRADATISCSECGTLAEGVTGREARPLELRHYLAHGFKPRALAEEGIEAVPWPEPAEGAV